MNERLTMTVAFTYVHPDGGTFVFTPPKEMQDELVRLEAALVNNVVQRGHDRTEAESATTEYFQEEVAAALTNVKLRTRDPITPNKTVTGTLGEILDHLWARAIKEMIAGLS